MMILTIAARELRSLFLSPLAWVVTAVVTFILAWMFLGQLDYYLLVQPRLAQMGGASGVTDFVGARVLGTASIIFLMVVPLLSMRLIAEERRAGTLPLLLASPASMLEIVLGKFLGLYALLLLMLTCVALMPASLALGTSLDWGQLAAAVLGLALQLAAFAAIGLYASTLTRQPTIAAVTTVGILLLFWLIDLAGSVLEPATALTKYLSMGTHNQSFVEGRFSSADAGYYLLLVTFFLGLSVRRLDAERLQD